MLVFVTAIREFLGRRYENRDTKVAAQGMGVGGLVVGIAEWL
jgi:hypothetical protein